MKSQIIITVEHGEDTDGLTALCESLKPSVFHDPYGVTVLDYEVKVDIEPVMTPLDALEELQSMGVDESRINETPFGKLPALYDTVMEEVDAFHREQYPDED